MLVDMDIFLESGYVEILRSCISTVAEISPSNEL